MHGHATAFTPTRLRANGTCKESGSCTTHGGGTRTRIPGNAASRGYPARRSPRGERLRRRSGELPSTVVGNGGVAPRSVGSLAAAAAFDMCMESLALATLAERWCHVWIHPTHLLDEVHVLLHSASLRAFCSVGRACPSEESSHRIAGSRPGLQYPNSARNLDKAVSGFQQSGMADSARGRKCQLIWEPTVRRLASPWR